MRVGVTGLGSIGSRYARWLAEMGGVSLALHDVQAGRVDELANGLGARPAMSPVELLAGGIDALVVSNPPDCHARSVCDALEAGVPVLVEKPIAHTRDAARTIERKCRDTGTLLAVVCNMRFHPGPVAVQECLQEIGTPLFARAWFGHRLSQMRPGGEGMALYAASAERGGGAILDCIHEIDLQQWLFGNGHLLTSSCSTLGPDRIPADDWAELVIGFDSGLRSSVHLDLLQRHKRRGWQVTGTDAALTWTSEGKMPERCEVWLRGRDSERCVLSLDHVDDDAVYRSMLASFLASVREGRLHPDLQTPEQAVSALELALQARESGGMVAVS